MSLGSLGDPCESSASDIEVVCPVTEYHVWCAVEVAVWTGMASGGTDVSVPIGGTGVGLPESCVVAAECSGRTGVVTNLVVNVCYSSWAYLMESCTVSSVAEIDEEC